MYATRSSRPAGCFVARPLLSRKNLWRQAMTVRGGTGKGRRRTTVNQGQNAACHVQGGEHFRGGDARPV